MLPNAEDLQVTEKQDILLQAKVKELIIFLHMMHHRYNPSSHSFSASDGKQRYQFSLLRQRR